LSDFSLANSSIVTWSHAGDFISDTPISQPGLYYGTQTLLLNDIIYIGGTNLSTQTRPAYQSLLCTVPQPDTPALDEITPAISVSGQIDLQWDAQIAVDNYTVYRSTEPIAEPISIEPIATTTHLYYHDTIVINATYHYAVKAHNIYGSSPLSNVRQVVVDIPTDDPEPAQFPPTSPTLSINTESPTTEYNIALVWSGDQAVDNYTIYRLDEPISNNSLPSPAQIKATAVATTDKNDFIDTVAGPGTYYYAVIARNESGVSNLSNSEYIIVVEISSPKNEAELPEIAGAPLFGILISGMIIYPIIKRRKRLL
jgi:fibronectin type 3 domain-containing protein